VACQTVPEHLPRLEAQAARLLTGSPRASSSEAISAAARQKPWKVEHVLKHFWATAPPFEAKALTHFWVTTLLTHLWARQEIALPAQPVPRPAPEHAHTWRKRTPPRIAAVPPMALTLVAHGSSDLKQTLPTGGMARSWSTTPCAEKQTPARGAPLPVSMASHANVAPPHCHHVEAVAPQDVRQVTAASPQRHSESALVVLSRDWHFAELASLLGRLVNAQLVICSH